MDNKDLKRFMSKVKCSHKTGCWIWQASKTDGYGMFSIKGVMCRAHRWIYEHIYGKIPKGKYLYHKCGKRNCVNPEHTFIGDKQDIYKNRFKNA